MPYVHRNALGEIDRVHRDPAADATEHLPDGDPALRAFIGIEAGDALPTAPDDAVHDSFSQLDADFVRVIEDVIDALIRRHVLSVTDLPPEAQAKLCARRHYRDWAAHSALRLYAEALPGTGTAPHEVPLP